MKDILLNRLRIFGNSTSQWVNANLLGGHEDESISGRAYRSTREGSIVWRYVRKAVNLPFKPWQEDHCFHSYLSDVHLCQERQSAHAELMKTTLHPEE